MTDVGVGVPVFRCFRVEVVTTTPTRHPIHRYVRIGRFAALSQRVDHIRCSSDLAPRICPGAHK